MPLVILAMLLTAEVQPDSVRLVRRAMVEYSLGEFGDAFLDYQSAYGLDPIPELLFDMAQCQRDLRHWERAEFLYRRYLSERPKAGNRPRVEAFIAELQQRQAEDQPPLPPPTLALETNAPPEQAAPPQAPAVPPGEANAAGPHGDPAALAHKASLEYNASAFGEAFLDYQAAYELDAVPELTFDMAQCQRGLHHWALAQTLYRRYLSERPQAANRAKVQGFIVLMQQHLQLDEAQAAEEAQTEAKLPPPKVMLEKSPLTTEVPPAGSVGGQNPGALTAGPPATPGRPIQTGVWAAGGIGVACLLTAGGLGLAVLAQPDHTSGSPPLHSLGYSQLQSINAEGTTAAVLAIGGAVLLGAGALFGLTSR